MALHPQLKALWEYIPLSDNVRILRETCPPGDVAILERSNGILFAPLITQKIIYHANWPSRFSANNIQDSCLAKAEIWTTV